MRLTRRYGVPPEEVWRALTEPDSLSRWLSPHDGGPLEAGAELELALGEEAPVTARVQELERDRVLELEWDAARDPSTVRFELRPDGEGGTVLVLDHSRIDERIGMRYMERWAQALDRLRRRVAP